MHFYIVNFKMGSSYSIRHISTLYKPYTYPLYLNFSIHKIESIPSILLPFFILFEMKNSLIKC